MSSTMTAAYQHQASGSQGRPEHFPFQHLPRDLRDLVYIQVLRGISVSPPALSEVSQSNRKETRDGYLSCVMYAPFPAHISSAPSLLLLNKQVHSEVKEILSKSTLETRPLTYRLDCMVADGGKLYPTWLSVPVLSSNVDVVEANLRLCGNSRVTGYGGMVMISSLLALLDRFLLRGAHFLSEPQPDSTGTTIGVLVLSVVTPPWEGLGGWGSPGTTILEFIVLCIEYIRGSIFISLFHEHGKRMGEKVKAIRLCVDGQERRTFVPVDVRGWMEKCF